MIIGVTALAGTSVYLSAGLVEPGLAVPVILGVVVGAFLGTGVLVRMTDETIRSYFIPVVILIGIGMILQGFA